METKTRIVLSAGGTGGHLFPAQSLADSLADYEIHFIAKGLSTNPYFDRNRFSFQEIESATFSLRNPTTIFKGIWKIVLGTLQANRSLKKYKPKVVVGFGSFFTLPLLIAAFLRKIPIILHEQNSVPGKVNRLFSSVAHAVTITFPLTHSPLNKKIAQKTFEVAFPLRKREEMTKEKIWDYFGLCNGSGKNTLLLFGGSQGARALNHLFLNALTYLPVHTFNILHFTGSSDMTEEIGKKYLSLGVNACVKAFEPRVDLAMQLADCAIVRAGAATICELIEYELPALLIPYPFATENHQENNGKHFISTVKGGKMYKERELNAPLFAKLILELIAETDVRRMSIAAYKNSQNKKPLHELIRDLLCN